MAEARPSHLRMPTRRGSEETTRQSEPHVLFEPEAAFDTEPNDWTEVELAKNLEDANLPAALIEACKNAGLDGGTLTEIVLNNDIGCLLEITTRIQAYKLVSHWKKVLKVLKQAETAQAASPVHATPAVIVPNAAPVVVENPLAHPGRGSEGGIELETVPLETTKPAETSEATRAHVAFKADTDFEGMEGGRHVMPWERQESGDSGFDEPDDGELDLDRFCEKLDRCASNGLVGSQVSIALLVVCCGYTVVTTLAFRMYQRTQSQWWYFFFFPFWACLAAACKSSFNCT